MFYVPLTLGFIYPSGDPVSIPLPFFLKKCARDASAHFYAVIFSAKGIWLNMIIIDNAH